MQFVFVGLLLRLRFLPFVHEDCLFVFVRHTLLFCKYVAILLFVFI